MSEFISKSDFDDAFVRALNRKEPKLETNKRVDTMNDDMDLIWGLKQMESELSRMHTPASNIMNICTEVLKQVKVLINEVK